MVAYSLVSFLWILFIALKYSAELLRILALKSKNAYFPLVVLDIQVNLALNAICSGNCNLLL
jgi:hypothetical protein